MTDVQIHGKGKYLTIMQMDSGGHQPSTLRITMSEEKKESMARVARLLTNELNTVVVAGELVSFNMEIIRNTRDALLAEREKQRQVIKQREAREQIRVRTERLKKKEELDYHLYIKLKEKFDNMDDEKLWHLEQKEQLRKKNINTSGDT